jgi:hypothetical protein
MLINLLMLLKLKLINVFLQLKQLYYIIAMELNLSNIISSNN